VYGLLGYLLLIGWIEKRPLSFLLLGAGPGRLCGGTAKLAANFSTPGVSWIAHLSGFGGGLMAALAVARETP
jgi:membrane associated rhomboid family serine protease